LSSEHVEWRLAAILAADVAGSCRLIGIDEEDALAQLKALRKTLLDPKKNDRRGRIIKRTGTALSLSFGSRTLRHRDFSAAWPNKISMCRGPGASNFASAVPG
jgi:class 3 adenylate cyclase